MIVFEGELIGKCRKFVLRKFSNMVTHICIITFAIVSFLIFEIAKTFGMSILWVYIVIVDYIKNKKNGKNNGDDKKNENKSE